MRWNRTRTSILGLGLALVAVSAQITSVGARAESTAFNAADQLTTVQTPSQTVSFSYDGDGQRFTKSTASGTTYYARDPQGQVLVEYAPTTIYEYVYLDGQKLCKIWKDANNVEHRFYYHDDMVGTPVAATNESGQRAGTAQYYPFGEEVVPAASGSEPKFTGKELDREFGLYYFGARYYDAHLGRFVSVDPVPGKNADPQTWNRYAYAKNNPFRFIDLGGKETGWVTNAAEWGTKPQPPLSVRQELALWAGMAAFPAAVAAGIEYGPVLLTLALTQGPQLGLTATELLNPNPGGFGLPASVAATFEGGEYTARTLAEDATVFRAEGRTFGKFFGATKPSSAAEAERLYNVADYGNDLLQVSTYRIPKGTAVYEGRVAGGEGWQLFVPNPREAGVQLVQTEPLVQYGH